MPYFVVVEDQRFVNAFTPAMGKPELCSGEPIVTYADFSENVTFADLFIIKKMFDYYFFVSDRFKTLLSYYDDDTENTPFFITSRDYEQQKTYWKINVKPLDLCFNPFKADKTEIEKLSVAMRDRYMARVLFEKREFLIVSLHIAENVLRKYFYGIKFIPITDE